MKCSFSRLLYPKTVEEARDGSYMIALFRPHEKVLDDKETDFPASRWWGTTCLPFQV